MGEEKTIYDMKLHERMNAGDLYVTRVPGGWIYETLEYNQDSDRYFISATTFVPFHNEFHPNCVDAMDVISVANKNPNIRREMPATDGYEWKPPFTFRHGHFIVRCRECKKVIEQCRCPSKDKAAYESMCSDCAGAEPDPTVEAPPMDVVSHGAPIDKKYRSAVFNPHRIVSKEHLDDDVLNPKNEEKR